MDITLYKLYERGIENGIKAFIIRFGYAYWLWRLRIFFTVPGVRITCDKYHVDREKIYLFNFGHKIATIDIDYFKDHSVDYFVY